MRRTPPLTPQHPQRERGPADTSVWDSGLQNWEGISLCGFKPPRRRQVTMAAPGHSRWVQREQTARSRSHTLLQGWAGQQFLRDV